MVRAVPVSVESVCADPLMQSVIIPMISCGNAPTRPINVCVSSPNAVMVL